MLTKVGSIFFNEEKLPKYKKLSGILFIVGIIAIIAFPYLSEETYIVEKLLKNSPMIGVQINTEMFNTCQKKYFYSSVRDTQKDFALYFSKQIFDPDNAERIYSKNFLAPRGDKKKFIMINLIYQKNPFDINKANKANSLFYTLMHFLSNKDNVTWLAKNVQFNYVPAKLFYENINEAYELLTSGKHNSLVSIGQGIDAIINFDLNEFDIENFHKFLFKINGMDSENVDMDYYKAIVDNLSVVFKKNSMFTTNEQVFSDSFKDSLRNTFLSIGSFISGFLPKINGEDMKYFYAKTYLYLLENIFDNFFMINNQINLNHMFISKNLNSVLIKIIPKGSDGIPSDNRSIAHQEKHISKNGNEAFGFVIAMERTIKIISKNEIDLFRGQYNYVLISHKNFVGYNYLILPILLIIRIFYELVSMIYSIEFKNINSSIHVSKIISMLLLSFIVSLCIMLHVKDIMLYMAFDSIKAYYLIIGVIFAISLLTLMLITSNENEAAFMDNILRFFLALNCWNFIFVNIGIGIVLTAIILPLEFGLVIQREKGRHFTQVFLVGIIIYGVLKMKLLISSMIENWNAFGNNVYIIITMTMALLVYRLSLIIVTEVKGKVNTVMKEKTE